MTRYAAFLRGVMPTNAKMPDVKKAFEAAGFTDVKTLLSSGNVVFDARSASETALRKNRGFRLDPAAKRIVTFLLKKPTAKVKLPIELDGARILAIKGREVFSAYSRTPKGPVFMTLLQKTFGKEQTTRTWETVTKVAR